MPAFDLAEDAPRLVLALGGYEGPLDLMLDLARREKIDLCALSMLALAEQYLAFIAEARALRLEIAGDYLVMAAWLTWLKSRLLIPGAAEDPAGSGEELAAALAARLERLAAFRHLAEVLAARREQQGLSHPRGRGEATLVPRGAAWAVSLAELVAAYGRWRIETIKPSYQVATRRTLSIPQARAMLERLVGQDAGWCPLGLLTTFLREQGEEAEPRSCAASGLVAALELAREGRIALRQEAPFSPLYLRENRK